MFYHRGKWGCGGKHDDASEARGCEEQAAIDEQEAAYIAQVGQCGHCDAIGHREVSCPQLNDPVYAAECDEDDRRTAGFEWLSARNPVQDGEFYARRGFR